MVKTSLTVMMVNCSKKPTAKFPSGDRKRRTAVHSVSDTKHHKILTRTNSWREFSIWPLILRCQEMNKKTVEITELRGSELRN